MFSRFIVLGFIACAISTPTVFGQATSPPTKAATAPLGLKDAFAGKFLIGTASDLGRLSTAELANIQANYNVITPENSMKPQPTHPYEKTYNWSTPDRLVKWCEDNHIKVWGHTLAWHAQTAGWFFEPGEDGKPVTKELGIERLKEHIHTVVGHFKGRLMGWDVVNEAINDGGPSTTENLRTGRRSPWVNLIGPEYITMAFKWAHEADPKAELNYNDYNIEQGAARGTGKHANSMLLLKRLIKDGAPITGVGIQGHWHLNTSMADVEKAITDYESLGLKISISELDVTTSGFNSGALTAGRGRGGAATPEAFQEQARVYAKLFEIFLRHAKSIERVTFWGISDSRSWLANRGERALLFDSRLMPKPAYQAIMDVGLGKSPTKQP